MDAHVSRPRKFGGGAPPEGRQAPGVGVFLYGDKPSDGPAPELLTLIAYPVEHGAYNVQIEAPEDGPVFEVLSQERGQIIITIEPGDPPENVSPLRPA